jgi:hypothetical protein
MGCNTSTLFSSSHHTRSTNATLVGDGGPPKLETPKLPEPVLDLPEVFSPGGTRLSPQTIANGLGGVNGQAGGEPNAKGWVQEMTFAEMQKGVSLFPKSSPQQPTDPSPKPISDPIPDPIPEPTPNSNPNPTTAS